MQKFSLFHGAEEGTLKAWHSPYVSLFVDREKVLDVGCGLGYFADLLKERGVSCVGLDIDPTMVAATRTRGHIAHLGDQNVVSKLDGKFDGVHISHVIEHLWGEDVIYLVEQCAAKLREGGRMVIRTPNWEVAEVRHKVFWLDHTHRRPYGLALIEKIARDSDFQIVASGHEPYGLQDLYLVADKGDSNDRGIELNFSHNPFPPPPLLHLLLRHVPRWARLMLRTLRRLIKRRGL